MKIAFIALASSYTEGMTYQENLFLDECFNLGHESLIISDTNKYVDGSLVECEEEDISLNEKTRLVRIKYKKIFNKFITSKIRDTSNKLIDILDGFKPDIVYCHNLEYRAIKKVLKYVKSNNVPLLADVHSTSDISCRTFLAKVFYKLFYRRYVRLASKQFKKCYCIAYETIDFVKKIYGLSGEKIELLPLGGSFIDEKTYSEIRNSVRSEFKLSENDILFVHSGKLTPEKRTGEIIDSFKNVSQDNKKLFIAGRIPENTNYLEEISKTKNISYLGWLTAEELSRILIASDAYIQIGSQSATLENAACLKNAIIAYPHKHYRLLFGDDCLFCQTKNELSDLICSCDKNSIEMFKNKSFGVAIEKLDYNKQIIKIIKDAFE